MALQVLPPLSPLPCQILLRCTGGAQRTDNRIAAVQKLQAIDN